MYFPHTESETTSMLKAIGVKRLEDLFQDVPVAHRFPNLDIPAALTEMEVLAELQGLAEANESAHELPCFLGAGAYHHYVPAAVDALLRRGEFLTAYTPYQPEVSQGTLQAIFDYQSLVAALTGMEVSNASHYDGASAVAEAVSMAIANYRGKRTRIIMSPGLNPQYRQTVHTYHGDAGIVLVDAFEKGDSLSLKAGPEALIPQIDDNTALVIVQYPDFFGRIYDFSALAEATHAAGALLAMAVNPIALGLLKPPGEMGADIVTGEGQSLGIPLSYGGPYLGIFATRMEYVRKMAGRLVGETIDNRGQRAYTLTLTAREQHIRREKATSNICTNQGLMALAATIYLSLLGKHGLRQLSELCYHKAHYAAQRIANLPGYQVWGEVPFYHEFVVRCPAPVQEINDHLLDHDVIGGFDLGQVEEFQPALENHALLAVTEMNSKEEIDLLVETLEEVSNG